MNTAIAAAQDPVRMARAMKLAVEEGRLRSSPGGCRASSTRRSQAPDRAHRPTPMCARGLDRAGACIALALAP
jgi:thiazole synthase ThiGH ThiG subunit